MILITNSNSYSNNRDEELFIIISSWEIFNKYIISCACQQKLINIDQFAW